MCPNGLPSVIPSALSQDIHTELSEGASKSLHACLQEINGLFVCSSWSQFA